MPPVSALPFTLVTYFPHNTLAEGEGPFPALYDMYFDGPDNVTVTPWGTLVLAEDGVRASHVLSSFVNMQSPGMTLAITGPWSDHLS